MTSQSSKKSKMREIQYEYSKNFAPVLASLQCSLFVTTYQAGKLVVIGVKNEALQISFHNFERAMGIAVGKTQIAVGGKDWIYFLKNAPKLASQIQPTGDYDACFLIRGAHFSGDIAIHEIAWGSKELVITNTKFSCLCTLNNNFNFVPKWRPSFISAIAPEDRCHLNGIAINQGVPQYASVLDLSDTAGGWRANKSNGGCILKIPEGNIIASGFAMPHSPRIVGDTLWVLNSGLGELSKVNLTSGDVVSILSLPGYPRGLAISNDIAFIGLSKVREKNTFGNLPISESGAELKCGVAIVDLKQGQQIGFLEFHSGVDEIFDVQLLQGILNPYISGPFSELDGSTPIWKVPHSS